MNSLISTSLAAPEPTGEAFLVCTGERHVARLIQSILERQSNTVICTYNGQEAVNLLRTRGEFDTPNIGRIVLDLHSPILGGFEVLRWIRESRYADVWVAMMLSEEEDTEQMAQLPYQPDVYLEKPVAPQFVTGGLA